MGILINKRIKRRKKGGGALDKEYEGTMLSSYMWIGMT